MECDRAGERGEEHMERRLYQVTGGGETVLTGGGQVQAERASQYPAREAVSHFSSLEQSSHCFKIVNPF